MTEALSRRAFFGQATMGTAAAAVTAPVMRPTRAWIIVAVDWQYNDEWSYPEGTSPKTTLYYDRDQALVACQHLCHEFFTVDFPMPVDFEPNLRDYDLPRGPDFDEETVTWDEMRAAGFPEPFFVQELTVPGDPAHE